MLKWTHDDKSFYVGESYFQSNSHWLSDVLIPCYIEVATATATIQSSKGLFVSLKASPVPKKNMCIYQLSLKTMKF